MRWLPLLLVASLAQAAKPVREVAVLALVAGKAVTDRQVLIDTLLEKPEIYLKRDPVKLLPAELEQGLARLSTQIMVIEESRIVGQEPVAASEIENALASFKKALGNKAYRKFLSDYELGESELRERLGQKLLVERALNARVHAALVGVENPRPEKKEELARKAIEDWLRQLRSRYKVQRFKHGEPA